MMRAVLIDSYGGPESLQLRDVARPVPAPEQVLIEVYAASINPIDTKVRDGSMAFRFGKNFPMILGFDAAGVVTAIGSQVTRFKVGDEVFTRSDLKTGCACAEYLAVSEAVVAHKPTALDYLQAAAIPLAGLTALQGLRDDCQVQPGQHVLIIGASGGVGTYAVQIAKAMGATVTAVCSSDNIGLVKQLGADHVIDYRRDSIFSSTMVYDAIYDVVGSQCFVVAAKSLVERGHFAAAVPSLGVIFAKFIGNKFTRKQAHFVMCKPGAKDLDVLSEWVSAGKLVSVIDGVYSLDDLVKAHRRIETKRSRGKLVIDIKQAVNE